MKVTAVPEDAPRVGQFRGLDRVFRPGMVTSGPDSGRAAESVMSSRRSFDLVGGFAQSMDSRK
jgi:hypothetical protein